MPSKLPRPIRLTLVLAGLLLLGGLGWAALHGELGGWIERTIALVREAGPLLFFVSMAVLPAIGFPLSAFLALAGPVFGPVLGFSAVLLCSIVAITCNVALSYAAAAHGLRPLVRWGVERLGYRLPEISPHAAWTALLVLRIIPGPPFFLQSLLLGLARVPFPAYMVVSVLVPAGYASAMILFGDAFVRGDRTAMIGAGLIFFVAGAIVHQLRRRLMPTAPALPPTPPLAK